MNVYNYDPATGEFLSSSAAIESPLEPGIYLVPADATKVAPPTPGINQKAVFSNGEWALVADYRGLTYWLSDRSQHEITILGVSPPAGYLTSDPGPTLAEAQAAQIASLAAAYQSAIVTPVSYTSKGGVTKTYQADAASVANLSQMLLAFGASQAVPSGFYWVSLDNTQVPFTYADMQGLAVAFGTQGAAAFQQLQSLKAQVNAATTVSAVQAVVWP